MENVISINSTEIVSSGGVGLFHDLYGRESDNLTLSENGHTVPLGHSIWYKFLIDGIGIVALSVLGIVGNAISVFILKRPKMRSSISILLIGLALADSILVFISSLVLGWPTIFLFFQFDITTTQIGKISPFLVPAATIGHMASIYFTIVITIERFLAVCHPLQAKRICTIQRAYVSVMAVATFSILYQIPRWFEYTYKESIDSNNVTHYVTTPTKLLENKPYQLFYLGLGYFLFEYLIPITTLITLNTLIYKAIRKSHRERRSLSSTQLHENSLAIMLSIIVLVYLICHAFPLVTISVGIITGNFEIPVFDSVRNFFVIFNSSINFVIYCTYGTKFRGVLLESLSEFRKSSLSKLGLLGNENEQNVFTITTVPSQKKQELTV